MVTLPPPLQDRLQWAEISILLERPLAGDSPLDYYEVSVLTEGPERIGSFEIVRVPLGYADAWERLDELSADLSRIGDVVIDKDTGEFVEELDMRLLQGIGDHWLILHSAQLSAAWRGYGLGPLLAGIALERLSPGASLAATFPAPLDDVSGSAYETAVHKLERVWSRLSFQPFHDGVCIIDLGLRDFADALSNLRCQYFKS